MVAQKLFLLQVRGTSCSQAQVGFIRLLERADCRQSQPSAGQLSNTLIYWKGVRKGGERNGGNKRTGKKQAAWHRVAGKSGSRHAEGSPPPPLQRGGLSPRLYHSTFPQGQSLRRHIPGGSTSHPGGAQPQGTAALAKPAGGLGGPLGFARSGCPQPGCHLSHPPLPSEGEEGAGSW